MGGAGSTGRITAIPNDDPRVIQVTDDVIRRLYAYHRSQQSQEKEPKESKSQQQKSTTESATSMDVDTNYGSSYGSEGQTTIETISAMEIRKQKDEELLKNDKFWEQNLPNIESKYKKTEVTLDQEFNKKLTQLRTLVPKNKEEQKCIGKNRKVAECYKTYPNQILKCSEVVNEFVKCVEKEKALM